MKKNNTADFTQFELFDEKKSFQTFRKFKILKEKKP